MLSEVHKSSKYHLLRICKILERIKKEISGEFNVRITKVPHYCTLLSNKSFQDYVTWCTQRFWPAWRIATGRCGEWAIVSSIVTAEKFLLPSVWTTRYVNATCSTVKGARLSARSRLLYLSLNRIIGSTHLIFSKARTMPSSRSSVCLNLSQSNWVLFTSYSIFIV